MASLLRLLGGPLSKMCIVTSVPMSFLLFGLQAVMDVKFSCPCRVKWNKLISVLILIVPSLLAFVIMLILLRPFKRKCTFTRSQEQKNSGTSQGQDIRGTSQGQDSSERSQSEKTEFVENLSLGITFLACLIPSIVWICLFLIDGDYVACAETDWDGQYACDKELHPNCLNWCKPTKLSPGKNETECYNKTRELISWSKHVGYIIFGIFSALMFISVAIYDCFISGKCDCCPSQLLSCCGRTAETQNEGQGPATMGQELQESGISATAGQKQQRSGSSVEWQPKSPATAGEGEESHTLLITNETAIK